MDNIVQFSRLSLGPTNGAGRLYSPRLLRCKRNCLAETGLVLSACRGWSNKAARTQCDGRQRDTKSMARKHRDDFASQDVESESVICPLCERIIPDDQIEDHHLVPRSKGGKIKVPLHGICHSHIHAAFTDAQLAKKFSTVSAILEDPEIQKFVNWVKTKPPGFDDEAEKRSRRR